MARIREIRTMKRLLLQAFFVAEMIVGSLLAFSFSGHVIGHPTNMPLMILGVVIFLIHALEYLLLSRVK